MMIYTNGVEKLTESLFIAIQEGSTEKVEQLLAQGADIEGRDKYNNTPLCEAVYLNRLDIVRYLLRKGANIRAKGENGKEPLFRAILNNNDAVVRLLLENNAYIECLTDRHETPLHIACDQANYTITCLLLEKLANVNARDKYGRTPLHIAARRNEVILILCLLIFEANIEAADEYLRTPLHEAANYNAKWSVKYLLLLGANIEAKDNKNRTPLHLAYREQAQQVIQLLEKAGSEKEVKDSEGHDPKTVGYNHQSYQARKNKTQQVIKKSSTQNNYKNENHSTAIPNEKEVSSNLYKQLANNDYKIISDNNNNNQAGNSSEEITKDEKELFKKQMIEITSENNEKNEKSEKSEKIYNVDNKIHHYIISIIKSKIESLCHKQAYEEAIKEFKQAKKLLSLIISDHKPTPNLVNLYYYFGLAYLKIIRHADAMRYLKKANTFNRELYGDLFGNQHVINVKVHERLDQYMIMFKTDKNISDFLRHLISLQPNSDHNENLTVLNRFNFAATENVYNIINSDIAEIVQAVLKGYFTRMKYFVVRNLRGYFEQLVIMDDYSTLNLLYAAVKENNLDEIVGLINSSKLQIGKNSSQIRLLKATLPNTQVTIEFEEAIDEPNVESNFTNLGVERETLSSKLLQLKDNLKDREFLAEEILTTFITYAATQGAEGFAPENQQAWNQLLQQRDLAQKDYKDVYHKILGSLEAQTRKMRIDNFITWLQNNQKPDESIALSNQRMRVIQAEANLIDYCKKLNVYEYYVTALADKSYEKQLSLGYKSVLLYAKSANINIYLWRKDAIQSDRLTLLEYHEDKAAVQTIHLLHSDEFTHFNFLAEPSVLKNQSLQKTLSVQQNLYRFFNSHTTNSLYRKGLSHISETQIRTLLNLSENFIIGTAVDDGGCGFDALAQMVGCHYSEKSLRQICHTYYLNLPGEEGKKEIDIWIHQLGINNPNISSISYLMVQYTGEELKTLELAEKAPTWFVQEVDGRILCCALPEVFSQGIHVIEITVNPISVGHYLITKEGYQQIYEEDKIKVLYDLPTMLISNKHFVPLLAKGKKEHTIATQSYSLEIQKNQLSEEAASSKTFKH